MSKKTVKISKSIKETEKIAEEFLSKIFKDKNNKTQALVVGLSGDLGAGKTAFTKAVAKHMGIKNKITSPTFVIIKNYKLKITNYKKFFHIDAYRLKNEKELLYLGWEKIIGDKENLIFVEWPENVSGIIPKNARFIYISTNENGHRSFKLK